MEIKETIESYFKKDGSRLIKEFKTEKNHLNEEWYHYYNLYCASFPYAVTVYEYSTQHLVMDYIEKPTLNNIIYEKIVDNNGKNIGKTINKVQRDIHLILASFYEFAIMYKPFWHDDLKSTNILLDDPLILIDPEAFKMDDIVRLNTDSVLELILTKSYINRHINNRIDIKNLNIKHLD